MLWLLIATTAAAQTPEILRKPDDPRWQQQAPASYRAQFETSRGNFVIEVTREWAPHGADHFYNLVRNGYYDGAKFHRVLPGYIVQWGIHGEPAINNIWKSRYIPVDPEKQKNVRGTIGFAMVTPDKRTTQVYINTADNTRNDGQGFALFGRVIEGMSVVDSLYGGYGAASGSGLRSGQQGPLEQGGNAYLREKFPRLDSIFRARVQLE